MRVPVEMPRLGYDSEFGKIGAWTAKVVDTVTAGQPIGELETEKATVEFEAPTAGTLVEIVHAAGAEVAVGAVIAYVEDGK
jgi:pyruvate/2-oxoglutarate dehydrogenase complex dihydrolipoamide acyltransferase (E2) component